jgi:peptidoglycan-associated lipoprotein
MSGNINRSTKLLLGGTMLLAVALSGCSFVKKQDLDDQLSSMRGEMEAERRAEIAEGDRNTASELNGRMDGLAARMDGLERALQSLADDFDARVQELEDGLRFDAPVYFEFDEDEVAPQQMAFLDRFARIVADYYPQSTVTVEGFTDPVGDEAYNLALGKRRAEAVKGYLVQQGGLSADHIRAVSYGEAADRLVSPSAHGPGQNGWQNRRVALVIDHTGA